MEVIATAIAGIIFIKFLEKSGEKLAEAFAKRAGGALARIAQRNPKAAQALASGDPKLVDGEVVTTVRRLTEEDAVLRSQLIELAALAKARFAPEILAQLQAAQDKEKVVTAIRRGVVRQIGLENIEAGELEAEVEQKTKAEPTVDTEQVGAKGVKILGKATIKINQES